MSTNFPARLIRQAEHVGHCVKPRLFVFAPQCRGDGAAREDGAVFGDVTQNDALAGARQYHFMLANDRAAAQGCKSDRAFFACAVARLGHQIVERNIAAFRGARPRSSAVPDGASTFWR